MARGHLRFGRSSAGNLVMRVPGPTLIPLQNNHQVRLPGPVRRVEVKSIGKSTRSSRALCRCRPARDKHMNTRICHVSEAKGHSLTLPSPSSVRSSVVPYCDVKFVYSSATAFQSGCSGTCRSATEQSPREVMGLPATIVSFLVPTPTLIGRECPCQPAPRGGTLPRSLARDEAWPKVHCRRCRWKS